MERGRDFRSGTIFILLQDLGREGEGVREEGGWEREREEGRGEGGRERGRERGREEREGRRERRE